MGLLDFLFGNKKEKERLERERQEEQERLRLAEEQRIAEERERRLAENKSKGRKNIIAGLRRLVISRRSVPVSMKLL